MFTDLMRENASMDLLQLNSAGISNEEFSNFVTESDKAIGSLIESYRVLMTEALTESAGVLNEETDAVAGQANQHVGQKIVAALKKLWAFIQKMFDQSINFVRTLVTSNKSFIEKVKPAVEKKNLSAEDMKKITMNSYDYKPDVIVLGNVTRLLAGIKSMAGVQYTAQNKEENDKFVSDYNEKRRASISAAKIIDAETLVQGGMTEKADWGKFKDELHKKLLGGGNKTVKSFSMDFFGKIESHSKNVDDIAKLMETAKKEFGAVIESIKKQAGNVKENTEDKNFRSGHIAFLNVLRALVSGASDVFMELKSMKLNILKKELSEARAFCMHAARYNPGKAMTESVVIPFDPLFEADADEDGEVLGESTEETPDFVW